MNRATVIVVAVLIAAIAIVIALKWKSAPVSTTEVTKEGQKELTVAVIPKGTSHVFWQSIHAGAMKAGQELGVEIRWDGPATEGERTEQIRIVEDMISRRVDGIVLAPLDDKALVPVIEKTARNDIPLTIIDSAADTDKYVSFVATDNLLGGVSGAEEMGRILKGKGRIAVMKYAPGSASTTKRERGFMDTIKEKFPDIEIVDAQYGQTTVSTALAVAEDILTKNPKLDGLFACNESTAVGALQALKSRDRAGKIKMVGFDCSPTLEKALRDGAIEALVIQNPFRMGYDGVKTIWDKINGKEPPRRIDTGVGLVTRENIDTPEIQALVTPDLDRWLK